MKQRIYKSEKNHDKWYAVAKNHKDENDFKLVYFFFPKNSEPEYIPDDKGKCMQEIDIMEMSFNCYKGEVGVTVWAYELLTNAEVKAVDGYRIEDVPTDLEMNKIEEDDLPFY